LIAVADCTGHGVPGAFMSMLGNSFLHEIVIEQGITQPAKILDELKADVINALKQTGASGESSDGMDISLLSFDDSNGTVEFAGAYNPLYHVHNGELIETGGDKQPVGYMRGKDGKVFTNHQVKVHKGDSLYILSDGYIDQFGGPRGKKHKSRQLKELLLNLQDLPMLEQEEKLRMHFNTWKQDYEQTDDVCVIGVRI